MPDDESGIATLGPTGEVNGWMVTGFSVEDQVGCQSLSLVFDGVEELVGLV